MSVNLPRELQEEIDSEVMGSIKSGLVVRRHNMAWSGFFLAGSILILSVLNPPSTIFITIILAVSALSVIWALMSISTSLNAQFDGLVILIKFYAEHNRVHRQSAQQDTTADAHISRG